MSRWLYEGDVKPKHVCPTPREAEPRAVWECDCGRVYRWSDNRGYGFEWVHVVLRAPFYRLMARGGRGA